MVSAVRVATARLVDGGLALDAAVDAVALLEDSPQLNAGTGSNLRIDGMTIECDAAVMTQDERFAAVGALRQTRNPVRVAQALLETPHRILAGEGARAFARDSGFAEANLLVPEATRRHAELLSAVGAASTGDEPADEARSVPFWRAWLASHRAPATAPSVVASDQPESAAPPPVRSPEEPSDTVAALVRDAEGRFSGAISSGGPALGLPGRIGDAAVPGAALWVAADGAVAISGRGESVIDAGLAHRVYERLRVVQSARVAAEWGLGQLHEPGAVLVLNRRDSHLSATTPVAWARNGPRGEESSAPLETVGRPAPTPSAVPSSALAPSLLPPPRLALPAPSAGPLRPVSSGGVP